MGLLSLITLFSDNKSVFNLEFNMHEYHHIVTLSEFWFVFIFINIIAFVGTLIKWKKEQYGLYWSLIVLFCLFSIWEWDYFMFADVFYKGLKNFRDILYPYFSYVSFGSYIVFRLLIWGTATYLVYLTGKRFKINTNVFFFVFVNFFLLTFSYARASLGMALYFYGLSFFIISDKNVIKRFFIVITCFFLAYCAHRSLLILILISPLCIFKPTKRSIFIILILVPILIILIKSLISQIMAGMLSDSSNSFAVSATKYTQLESELNFNWKWALVNNLRNWSFYISLVYIIYKLYFNGKRHICNAIKSLITICILIEIISITIINIAGNELLGLWIVGYRYLYMCGIPICILATYSYCNKVITYKELFYVIIAPALLYMELFLGGKILTLQFLS